MGSNQSQPVTQTKPTPAITPIEVQTSVSKCRASASNAIGLFQIPLLHSKSDALGTKHGQRHDKNSMRGGRTKRGRECISHGAPGFGPRACYSLVHINAADFVLHTCHGPSATRTRHALLSTPDIRATTSKYYVGRNPVEREGSPRGSYIKRPISRECQPCPILHTSISPRVSGTLELPNSA